MTELGISCALANDMNTRIRTLTLHSRRIASLLAFVVLTGCGGGDALEKLKPGDTILAFGDSLTFGYGAAPSTAYPAVLEEMTGLNVINAGITGETTEQGRERLPKLLDEHDPTLVILFEGGNDILHRMPEDHTKANLDRMIRDIKAHGAQLILVAVPEKSLFSSAAPWYTELAEEHDVPLEGSVVSRLLKKPEYKSDSVHFNEDGYRIVAESIHEVLAENGAF